MSILHMTPHGLPSLHQVTTGLKRRDNGQLVADVLLIGAWLCWVLFTISLIPEIAATIRRQPATTLPGLALFQRSAGALVAAIVIGFTLAPLMAGHGAAAGAATPTRPPLPSITTTQQPTQPTAAQGITGLASSSATRDHAPLDDDARQESGSPATAAATYEVQRRDTLWGIAECYLHDPLRYTDIAKLNPAAVGPDNEITPGTILLMPPDATGLPRHIPTPPGQLASAHDADVTVKPGDTLWDLEREVTGHGDNWQQAWQANADRAEPDGATFTDPDLIQPGWTLSIPTDANLTPADTTPKVPTTRPTAPSPATDRTNHPGGPAPSAPAPTTPAPHATPALPFPAPAATRNPNTGAPSHPTPKTADTSPRSSRSEVIALAGGGGLLLAGASLSALLVYRRRQFRGRNPGRTIAATAPELITIERAIITAGNAGIADVTWLDHALRSLVHTTVNTPDGQLPDVIAVRMTDQDITLVLADPALGTPESVRPSLPAPWRANDIGTRWSIHRDDTLPYDDSRRGYSFAPYPTLTSVGYTAGGEHWLLDLERIGSLSLTGDPTRCLNLARFLVAELAHNTWSEMLQVTLVGFGNELVPANPDRLTYTDDLAAATAAISQQLATVTAAMRCAEIDVLTGRLRDLAGDAWAPHVLLVAPHLHDSDLAVDDVAGLDRVLNTIARQDRRTPLAVTTVRSDRGDPTSRPDVANWHLTIDSDGILSIPALDLELIAQQIPIEEARQLAQLLAHAAEQDDEPIPAAHGNEPWDANADACGQLTLDFPASDPRVPEQPVAEDMPALRLAGQAQAPANSILPLPAETYLQVAATTEDDLRALAPIVTDQIRARVEDSDPTLDADLALWSDPLCPRPRLTLLGVVRVRAQGELPARSPQLPFHTEIVAYLATRSDGVLSTVYAETMWPNEPDVIGKTKVRQSISTVRKWLGADPQTGQDYLPSGLHDAGAARYRIVGALVDSELFRRLRVRGLARGAAGIDDLWKALDLVQARPFSETSEVRDGAPGGYTWLNDANFRLDHEYSAMIVDVAHTVATHHFGNGEPDLAAKAAQVALRSGSYEDVPLLDLVQASMAQDKRADADSYIKQILSNYAVDEEEDLPPRTAEVLFRLRNQWVHRAS
jgi:nucleoid-associated protein YgaU